MGHFEVKKYGFRWPGAK